MPNTEQPELPHRKRGPKPMPAADRRVHPVSVRLILQDTPPPRPGGESTRGDTSGSVQADAKGVISVSKSPVLGSRPEAMHSAL